MDIGVKVKGIDGRGTVSFAHPGGVFIVKIASAIPHIEERVKDLTGHAPRYAEREYSTKGSIAVIMWNGVLYRGYSKNPNSIVAEIEAYLDAVKQMKNGSGH